MLKIKKRSKAFQKLNLIPILDAVFIFIFFLLMSAQFLEIYEIGSDAPAVSTINPEKDEKKPLNLTLKIDGMQIIIQTGLDGHIYKKIKMSKDSSYLLELQKVLSEIKTKNIDEESIILKPSSKVPYKNIVKIMDAVREQKSGTKQIMAKNKAGKEIVTNKLFQQIIFETM